MADTYTALVPPRPWVVDRPGLCLRYAQSFFGAPVAHRSALDAWDATVYRHGPDEPIPDVPVILWYSHVGAYDDGNGPYRGVPVGGLADWGHVTPIVPGVGIYSSPANPYGGASFDVYGTIAEVEQAFNATYLGWSEDINGLRVAMPGPTITPHDEEEEDMNLYFEAISNSSPLKPGDDATSRIWAGERKIKGITFSSVWERSADGSVRRLYKGEWEAIIAANEKIGRTIPLAKVAGNVIEQLVYGKRA